MKGLSLRVLLLLLGILFVSLFMSFKINERFGPREGFESESQVQDEAMDINSPPIESIPEPPQTQDIDVSDPTSIDSTEYATKPVPTNPIPANTVNAMSQRLGLTSEDKTNMQSIITKVFANAGTFAADKLGIMMEGFASKSSIASTQYM